MLRSARAIPTTAWLVAAGLVSCTPAPPPPMDTSALPSATTSAEPLYITTEPEPAAEPATSSSASVPAPEPALPSRVSLESARTAACPQKHCWRSWLVPRPGRIEASPTAPNPDLGIASPVAVWQEKLGSQVKLDFPRAKGLGLMGVVLDGVVSVAPSEGGSLAAMKPWSAFAAPGAGLSLTAHGEGGLVLLVAFALDGKLEDRLASLRKSEKAVYWEKRPGPFVVDDLERIDRQTWAGGRAHAWLGFEPDRSPQAYLGVLMMSGDLPVAGHEHEASWEVLVPLRASGELVLSGEGIAAETKHPGRVPVRAGEVVTMPPGVHHAFEPGGAEPLLAVQLFVPPGPEQRYRKLAQDSDAARSAR